jgi:Domain of unknown function (DUF4440)
MKEYFSRTMFFALIGGAALMFFGCAGQQNPNNTNATTVAEPTPDKPAIEAQLKALEYDWPRIVKERDGAAVQKLEADDIMLVYNDGSEGSKEQDIKDIESGESSSDPQEISDLTVNVLDNNTAIVRSRTKVAGDRYRITDGKCEIIFREFRSIDTFVRRNGQWQMIASATVPVTAPAPTPSPTPAGSPSANGSPRAKASPALKVTPSRAPTPVPKTTPQ